MELHPCPCGETDFGTTSTLAFDAGVWMVRYVGQCVECGRPRAFEFRQPDEITVPAEASWADTDQPSELLDAGEWLWVADRYAAVPVEDLGGTQAERDLLRTDLLAAIGAIDEVLKFIPAGASRVPDSAFWSDRGRRMRAQEPDRFGRMRLLAAREAYVSQLADLGAQLA